VAILWGPLAGYYVKNSKVPLEMRLIPEYNKIDLKGKEYWNISVATRHKDKQLMALINTSMEKHKAEIADILKEYGIPTVPVKEGDSVYKKD
jgi:mxaJ protein